MVLRAVVVLCLLLSTIPARAQVSGSIGVLSDYRYRGISLSDGKPVAQLTLAWDHPDGAYAGVLASSLHHGFDGRADTLLLPYLGHAWRLRPGLHAEAGVQYWHFHRVHAYDHAEFYAALSAERIGARLSYAPRYFGQAALAYAEVNASQPLGERLRLLGHVGLSHARDAGYGMDRNRVDLRLGLGWRLAGFDLQLGWASADLDGDSGMRDPLWGRAGRSGWVLGVSRSW